MPEISSDKLIVGIDTSDDAAVYKINDDVAVIQTVDFFTPIVDDPYTFGQIAAANSLSDIYAMGGTPALALNIACFPSCMDMNILGEILHGGADKVMEAGAVIAGGHTIDDKVPKYGLSVMGFVHPLKVLPNANSKPGDVLILTKPVGTGIINTAIKGEIAEKEQVDNAVKVMSTLNRYASEIASKYKINACTDITGFGLAGHAFEMAKGSNVCIHIDSSSIKLVDGAAEFAKMGIIPAGTYRNRKYVEKDMNCAIRDDYLIDCLFDPQTSGGLLYSMPEADAIRCEMDMKNSGIDAFIAGYADGYDGKYIYIE